MSNGIYQSTALAISALQDLSRDNKAMNNGIEKSTGCVV